MLENFNISRILRTALSSGGEFAEIYLEEGAATQIVAEDGKIEKVLSVSDRGVSIRVISDFRTAFGYTNEVTEKSLLELAASVSSGVKGGIFDRNIIVGAAVSAPVMFIRLHPDNIRLEQKVALVAQAERAARESSAAIRQVMAVYRDGVARMQVANSLGEFSACSRIGTMFASQVVAASGDLIQTGYESNGACRGFELFDEKSAVEIALAAAKRAEMMLSARRAPGGMMPVVLSSEAGGTMIHEAIGHGLEADLVQGGVSVYRGKLGEQVASSLVTVIDDSTIPYARGSFYFDSEGVRGQKNVLVENGILKGYLYDRLTGMKEGCSSTGNGRRESYHAKPIVRMTNTLIAPGSTAPEEIVKTVPSGLFVRKMGGGQVNTVTGDFMFEVTEGYLIENGAVCEPVRGATLTGSGSEVLKNILMVGSDLGFGIGTCGKDGQGVPVSDAQPTLLIGSMTVGGAV
ncbi:MAG: TldD/PmbA family protein [Geobacteraceae bacterium]|nr:TldD/PmbA family protein [Geobacteraceae bacterium]